MASDYEAQKVVDQAYHYYLAGLEELLRLMSCHSNSILLRGQLFKLYAAKHLPDGGIYECRDLDSGEY